MFAAVSITMDDQTKCEVYTNILSSLDKNGELKEAMSIATYEDIIKIIKNDLSSAIESDQDRALQMIAVLLDNSIHSIQRDVIGILQCETIDKRLKNTILNSFSISCVKYFVMSYNISTLASYYVVWQEYEDEKYYHLVFSILKPFTLSSLVALDHHHLDIQKEFSVGRTLMHMLALLLQLIGVRFGQFSKHLHILRDKFADVLKAVSEDGQYTEQNRKLFLKVLVPSLFDTKNITDDQKGNFIDLALEFSSVLPIKDLTTVEYESFLESVNDYIKVITELSDKNYIYWHKLWMFLVRWFGKKLHQSMNIMNKLLRVVELAFRNSSCERRLKGYDCWRELIDNCSLDMDYISSAKQIRLLLTPLRAKFSRQESVIVKRFEVYVYLIEKLQDRAVLVLKEFLEFCFGEVGENTEPSKAGQGKSLPELWLSSAKVLLTILGHSHGSNDQCLEADSNVHIKSPVLNSDNISSAYYHVINSVVECCKLLKEVELNQQRNTVLKCIWGSLFKIVFEENVTQKAKCIETIGKVLDNLLKDYDPYCHSIAAIIFKETVKLDKSKSLPLILNILDSFLHVVFSVPLSKESHIEIKQFIGILGSPGSTEVSSMIASHMFDGFTKFKTTETNTNFIARMWVFLTSELDDCIEGNLLDFLLWPVSHAHQLDLVTEMSVYDHYKRFVSIFVEKSDELHLALFKSFERTLKNNPLLLKNVLTLVTMFSPKTTNKEIMYVTLEILGMMLLLVPFTEYSVGHRETLELYLKKIFEADVSKIYDQDTIKKLCTCVEHLLKQKQYDILTCVEETLINLPDNVKWIYGKYLTLDFLMDIFEKESDVRVTEKIHKVMELLRNVKNPEPKKDITAIMPPGGRSAKIASLVKQMPQSPHKAPASPSSLRLFGKDIETRSPINVIGSQLKNTKITPSKNNQMSTPPQKKKPATFIDDESNSKFVFIQSEVKVDKNQLTEHQKETLKKRREDIPALYQDLSQSVSQSLDSTSTSTVQPNEEDVFKKPTDVEVRHFILESIADPVEKDAMPEENTEMVDEEERIEDTTLKDEPENKVTKQKKQKVESELKKLTMNLVGDFIAAGAKRKRRDKKAEETDEKDKKSESNKMKQNNEEDDSVIVGDLLEIPNKTEDTANKRDKKAEESEEKDKKTESKKKRQSVGSKQKNKEEECDIEDDLSETPNKPQDAATKRDKKPEEIDEKDKKSESNKMRENNEKNDSVIDDDLLETPNKTKDTANKRDKKAEESEEKDKKSESKKKRQSVGSKQKNKEQESAIEDDLSETPNKPKDAAKKRDKKPEEIDEKYKKSESKKKRQSIDPKQTIEEDAPNTQSNVDNSDLADTSITPKDVVKRRNKKAEDKKSDTKKKRLSVGLKQKVGEDTLNTECDGGDDDLLVTPNKRKDAAKEKGSAKRRSLAVKKPESSAEQTDKPFEPSEKEEETLLNQQGDNTNVSEDAINQVISEENIKKVEQNETEVSKSEKDQYDLIMKNVVQCIAEVAEKSETPSQGPKKRGRKPIPLEQRKSGRKSLPSEKLIKSKLFKNLEAKSVTSETSYSQSELFKSTETDVTNEESKNEFASDCATEVNPVLEAETRKPKIDAESKTITDVSKEKAPSVTNKDNTVSAELSQNGCGKTKKRKRVVSSSEDDEIIESSQESTVSNISATKLRLSISRKNSVNEKSASEVEQNKTIVDSTSDKQKGDMMKQMDQNEISIKAVIVSEEKVTKKTIKLTKLSEDTDSNNEANKIETPLVKKRKRGRPFKVRRESDSDSIERNKTEESPVEKKHSIERNKTEESPVEKKRRGRPPKVSLVIKQTQSDNDVTHVEITPEEHKKKKRGRKKSLPKTDIQDDESLSLVSSESIINNRKSNTEEDKPRRRRRSKKETEGEQNKDLDTSADSQGSSKKGRRTSPRKHDKEVRIKEIVDIVKKQIFPEICKQPKDLNTSIEDTHKRTQSQDTQTQDTESLGIEAGETQLHLDLPQKSLLTESEKEVARMDTATLSLGDLGDLDATSSERLRMDVNRTVVENKTLTAESIEPPEKVIEETQSETDIKMEELTEGIVGSTEDECGINESSNELLIKIATAEELVRQLSNRDIEVTMEGDLSSPVKNQSPGDNIGTPGPFEASLPTSPITGDTPNRTSELIINTSDISPIGSKSGSEKSSSDDEFVESRKLVPVALKFDHEEGDQDALKQKSPEKGDDAPQKMDETSPEKAEKEVEIIPLGSPPKDDAKNGREVTSVEKSGRFSWLKQGSPATHRLFNRRKTGHTMSPSASRIKKLMSNVKPPSESETTDEINQEDILTFTREVPSPLAVPRTSILKRKYPETFEEGMSPCAKRKRVNFSDPCTTSKKVFLREETAGVSQCLFTMTAEDDIDKQFLEVLAANHIVETPQTESDNIETQPSLQVINPLLLRDDVPIYPELVDCEENVSVIARKLTGPMFINTLLSKLDSNNIKTIGDLAKQSEACIARLPFKTSMVGSVFKALDHYYHKNFKSKGTMDKAEIVTVNGERQLVTKAKSPSPPREIKVEKTDVKEELSNILERAKSENIPMDTLCSLVLGSSDQKQVISWIKTHFKLETKDLVDQEDFPKVVKHVTETAGLPRIFEILTESLESAEDESVYFDCMIKHLNEKRPLSSIIDKRSIEELKTAIWENVENQTYNRKEVLDVCFLPYVHSIDLASFFNKMTVVEVGDIVLNRLDTEDYETFTHRLISKCATPDKARDNILQNFTIPELTNNIIEKGSSKEIVSSLTRLFFAIDRKDKKNLCEIFQLITSSLVEDLPLSLLMELSIEFQKKFPIKD